MFAFYRNKVFTEKKRERGGADTSYYFRDFKYYTIIIVYIIHTFVQRLSKRTLMLYVRYGKYSLWERYSDDDS